MKAAILGLVRHILTTAGGYFVGNGTLTGAESETAIGALVALVGVVWSVIEKRQRN